MVILKHQSTLKGWKERERINNSIELQLVRCRFGARRMMIQRERPKILREMIIQKSLGLHFHKNDNLTQRESNRK